MTTINIGDYRTRDGSHARVLDRLQHHLLYEFVGEVLDADTGERKDIWSWSEDGGSWDTGEPHEWDLVDVYDGSGELDRLGQIVRDINRANGWDIVEGVDWYQAGNTIPAKLALLHSEVSEALEAFRKYDLNNFVEELADVFIRTMDIAGGITGEFHGAVMKKLEVNRGRGYRHGGKRV